MIREQFIEYLQLHGSDISVWPEEIREQALSVYRDSVEIRGLVEQEKQFESMLSERSIDEPASDFERRITLSAKPKIVQEEASLFSSFIGLLTIPKPALTFAFLLLFGFSLGFFYDSYADIGENEDIALSEYITFDEGEYYE